MRHHILAAVAFACCVGLASASGFVPQAYHGCTDRTRAAIRNCKANAKSEAQRSYYYAFALPTLTGTRVKFGVAQSERVFDGGGRYAIERRALERKCNLAMIRLARGRYHGHLLDNAISLCIQYHFRFIATVACTTNQVCMDQIWRCGIARYNADAAMGFSIAHAPARRRAAGLLRSGHSEFYRMTPRAAGGANFRLEDAFDILHQVFIGDPNNFDCREVRFHNGFGYAGAGRRAANIPGLLVDAMTLYRQYAIGQRRAKGKGKGKGKALVEFNARSVQRSGHLNGPGSAAKSGAGSAAAPAASTAGAAPASSSQEEASIAKEFAAASDQVKGDQPLFDLEDDSFILPEDEAAAAAAAAAEPSSSEPASSAPTTASSAPASTPAAPSPKGSNAGGKPLVPSKL